MANGLTYTKDLHASIVEWYKDAHARAQLMLTLDGAFVTLLTGAVVSKASDLRAAIATFGPETWVFLALMVVAFAVSASCSILAVMPRGLRSTSIKDRYDELVKDDVAANRTPTTSVMWWSQFIRQMGRTTFMTESVKVGDAEEQKALASQIVALSDRLHWKYRCVYAAVVATGAAVLSLLLATAFYVIRLGF